MVPLPTRSPDLDRLRRLGLLVVTGKGGVGKTTVAAALAVALSSRDSRVLLLEMDPRESAHRLLGLPPSDGDRLEASPTLSLQNIQARRVVDRLVAQQVRIGLITRKVLASPIYEHFVAGCPGLEELAILGHAQRSLEGTADRTGDRFDLVVLDAPATGHGLALLAAPRLVSDVIEKGPFGRLAAELAVFVGSSERCGVAVVTTAEGLPVQETLELVDRLREEHHRSPELVVANGLYPPWPPERSPSGPGEDTWQKRRGANDRALEDLRQADPGPIVELPWEPVDDGAELIRRLAVRIAGGP